ncbi:MAG: hypothetical protein IKW87_12390 [Ruminococcus sp.]|nr:hypothetical protein [Ruminococcus sp.]
MDIRLVTTSFNDEVHGTFNEKKTGCGINLLKSENVTRYHRGGIMTDLGELTCEKCKTKIAKEMIKSDQKEMKLLLKEEKLRAKKGIVDEGIVPLGNTTAKPTKDQTRKPAPAPKPVQKPEPVAPEQPANLGATIPGTGVAIDNSLAQFAINKPQAEPEPAPAVQDDFLNQFAINKPQQEEEPAPAPAAQDDFLAQFAVPAPAQAEPEPVQEAPAAPPVIDDISAALAAAQNNMPKYEAPVQPEPVQQAAPAPAAPQTDDILSMFSIETPEKPAAQTAGTYDNDSSVIDVAEESLSAVEPAAQAAPAVIDDISAAVEAAQMNVPKYEASAQPAPVQQAAQPAPAKDSESVSEWDLIANQLFGVNAQPASAEAPAQEAAPVKEEASAPAQAAPKTIEPAVYQAAPAAIDDISAAAIEEANKAIEPAVYQASAPVIDDISAAVEAAQSAAPKAAAPVQQAAPAQASAPVIDDISAAVEAAQSAAPKAAAPVQQTAAPAIDDISAAVEAAQNAAPKAAAPVQQAAPAQASAPIIDDIASAVAAAAQNAPKSVAPAQQAAPAQASAPVIDDIASAVAAAAQNAPKAVAPAPAPVKPAPVKPAPAKPAPAPAVQQTAPAGMPDMGQVISVPQITGYDAAKQPIYTYVQMQITGYGENGQPVLSPVPGQEIPEFEMPFNKNTRLQEAIRAAQEVPTSAHEMTPGQRIAAAEAAKGSPISANVSKIATNPHSRATSQAFINAISESKEYANQSLTDTQGLQQRTRVIGSIEDVLSQLGDNSLKQKKAIDAQVQQSIPSFQEYKAPARTSPMQSAPSRPAPRPMPVDDRPLTKAELKAMKKQEKIDAKFRKEMAKRGGY